ncbi:MAG: hypothetical protein ACKOE7_12745, partial [Actinomycetota bacterium]
MIRRHAPDDATRDRVLANDLYKTLTSRVVQLGVVAGKFDERGHDSRPFLSVHVDAQRQIEVGLPLAAMHRFAKCK